MKNLSEFFKVSMFMTGTPVDFQKQISKEFDEYRCDCSIKEALSWTNIDKSKNYITEPCLNLVKSSSRNLPNCVMAVYENEKNITAKENMKQKDKFPIHMIVNCSSIDEIYSCTKELRNHPTVISDNIHFIAIHSTKEFHKDSIAKPMIDFETDLDKFISNNKINLIKHNSSKDECENKCKDWMEVIENIDKNEINIFKNEPIILFQVDMISEGINLCSFNSCICQSKADIRSMQQIGRVLRNYTVGSRQKKIDGHAGVYALIENEQDVIELLEKLAHCELTDDVFQWGGKIDLSNGGSPDNPDDDEPAALTKFVWENITDVEIQEYKLQYGTTADEKNSRRIPTNILADIPADLFAKCIKVIHFKHFNTKHYESAKNNIKKLKELTKKNKESKNTKEHKKEIKKEKTTVQSLLNDIRYKIIHFRMEQVRPWGMKEWENNRLLFLTKYLAKGDKKLGKNLNELIDIVGKYMCL